MWRYLPFLPAQASSAAGGIDLLFGALTLVTVVFSLLILIAIVYFAVKYRRGHKVDRSNAPHEGLLIEMVWTLVPLGIAVGLFIWSTVIYFANIRSPVGVM